MLLQQLMHTRGQARICQHGSLLVFLFFLASSLLGTLGLKAPVREQQGPCCEDGRHKDACQDTQPAYIAQVIATRPELLQSGCKQAQAQHLQQARLASRLGWLCALEREEGVAPACKLQTADI